jgi:hopanoid biosynthesis associated protein HpnK
LRNLVVTADDFGAAREVDEAIETAHRDGILTAASLMVGAPATEDAVARARQLPSLRVGLHIVLTDGAALLPASAVGDLVTSEGRFHANMARAAVSLYFSRRARAQLAAEIEAQFEAFAATGLALDHVNAHKHFHLHPTVARLIVAIGRRFGLSALRVPWEPTDILRAAQSGALPSSDWLTAPWAGLLRRRARAAGLRAPDRVFGLAWSGAMTRNRLLGLIRHLPGGLSEIYCHPATAPYPGSAPGYRYAEELAALIDPDVVAATRDPSLRLGGFCDFPETGTAAERPLRPRQAGPDGSMSA